MRRNEVVRDQIGLGDGNILILVKEVIQICYVQGFFSCSIALVRADPTAEMPQNLPTLELMAFIKQMGKSHETRHSCRVRAASCIRLSSHSSIIFCSSDIFVSFFTFMFSAGRVLKHGCHLFAPLEPPTRDLQHNNRFARLERPYVPYPGDASQVIVKSTNACTFVGACMHRVAGMDAGEPIACLFFRHGTFYDLA